MLTILAAPQKFLFWSAPVASLSDFVIEDPLAFDYLSQQIGNRLFAGLSTRTSRGQYFTMVLYGLSIVDRFIQENGTTSDVKRKGLFERWERMWALATQEYRGGDIPRGDGDSIRGQRGATRAWKPGNDSLLLDYKLIGRQSELGGLGAYSTSLLNNGLLRRGSLKPTSIASELIDAFWADLGSSAKVSAYDQYARLALEPDQKKLPRKHGAVTLKKVGELSRLSSLVENNRKEQQNRLWHLLFEGATDHTLRFSDVVRLADKAEIYEPRAILQRALAGKLGALSIEQTDVLRLALDYGDVQAGLMTSFNRAFATAVTNGWRVDEATAAADAFGVGAGDVLRIACSVLLDSPAVGVIRNLDMHGKEFLELVGQLRTATPTDALEAVVHYHARIHRERRHGTPWVRLDEKRLVIDVGAYGARSQQAGAFPSFKFGVIRSLLRDLGRLS